MDRIEINRLVWRHPAYFLAFGFGSGLSPYMPGTFGTLIAIPFYWLIQVLSWPFYLSLLVLTFIGGIWLCDVTERAIGIPDYPGIVWDEMVGMWCTLFLVPPTWFWILLGFLLFRFLDIVKPWPISWLNRHVHRGLGIMVDDIVAGIGACLLLHLLLII